MSSILFADDHELVREALSAFLTSKGGMFVTQTGDVETSLKEIRYAGGFDLVLLDFTMPGMDLHNGLPLVIRANAPRPVAVISGTATPDVVRSIMDTGATGFLPKTLTPDEMLQSVQDLIAGKRVSQETTVDMLAVSGVNMHLTPRELDVLRGICEGKANKEIAIDLDVQEVTVKLHVKTLTRKLNAKNRTHAAMLGRDLGFV